MEEISGVAIPVEEKVGDPATVKPKVQKIPVGDSESGLSAAVNWQGNSVASLFASRLSPEGDSDL